MGTWNAHTIRRAANAFRSGSIASGPWDPPDGWRTIPSWRYFRQFSVASLIIEEHLIEHFKTGSPDGGGISVTETIREQWTTFEAIVPAEELWRAQTGRPSGMSMWFHNSVTPWGDGLYEAEGQI